MNRFPILVTHDWRNPIGYIEINDEVIKHIEDEQPIIELGYGLMQIDDRYVVKEFSLMFGLQLVKEEEWESKNSVSATSMLQTVAVRTLLRLTNAVSKRVSIVQEYLTLKEKGSG